MTERNDLTESEAREQPGELLTALYAREEPVDCGKGTDRLCNDAASADSDSVGAQLEILQKYMEEHSQLRLAGTYVDRSYSDLAAAEDPAEKIADSTATAAIAAAAAAEDSPAQATAAVTAAETTADRSAEADAAVLETSAGIEDSARVVDSATAIEDAAGAADSVTAIFPELAGFPELIRLMQDVRTGKIHCVVVRSFTDFGRERMETVYYIENLFRYLNVRFISVEDDFDSDREEDMRRIREFAAERRTAARAQSLSRQRCESAKARARRPDAMPSGSAPYGYLVSEDGKSYVTDQETAPFVRMIFKWAASGLSSPKIAQRMELLGVETPGQRRLGKSPDPSKWDAHVVLKILQNPNYTGDIYIGRMQQALYKSQTRRRTSPDEWVIREHTHEPLVTREDFRRVQEIIASNDRSSGGKSNASI